MRGHHHIQSEQIAVAASSLLFKTVLISGTLGIIVLLLAMLREAAILTALPDTLRLPL
jgi:hypothetical protein